MKKPIRTRFIKGGWTKEGKVEDIYEVETGALTHQFKSQKKMYALIRTLKNEEKRN